MFVATRLSACLPVAKRANQMEETASTFRALAASALFLSLNSVLLYRSSA